MSDTTTTLNVGAGGDKMDESLVTQAGDGVTQAKRPRVVIAGDASGAAVVDPVIAEPTPAVYSVPVMSSGVVDDTRQSYIAGEIRPLSLTSDGRLRVASSAGQTYLDFFGDTSPLCTDPHGFLDVKGNPYDFGD